MSYLDFPRFHFTATFTADPSTINNSPVNYNESTKFTQRPSLGDSQVELSWNPYGSGIWSIQDGLVTSYVNEKGDLKIIENRKITVENVVQSKSQGGSSPTYYNVKPKLVDLDTDEQTRTKLFGMILAFFDAEKKRIFSGYFEQQGCLKNLWFFRVPSKPGDSGAGGVFQSIIPLHGNSPEQKLSLGDVSNFQFLKTLEKDSPGGLSININTFAFDSNHSSPTFRQGKVWGTVGFQSEKGPKYKIAKRMLYPQDHSRCWNAPAMVNEVGDDLYVSVDLGNAIPEQSVGGKPLDLGTMELALMENEKARLLREIDYTNLPETAGVVTVKIDQATCQELTSNPLAILTTKGEGASITVDSKTMSVQMMEAKDGVYITTDQSSLYMNPGDQETVQVYASKFGKPHSVEVPLELIPVEKNVIFNNFPPEALSFPDSVTTDDNGFAEFTLTASNPLPKTDRRANINGQIFFIGGAWSKKYNANQQNPSSLSVKVFNSLEIPDKPTWQDVSPIFYQFYTLYAYMASIVDLSSYTAIKKGSKMIRTAINRELDNPGLMPVTRELSADQVKLITKWIDCGCLEK